MHRGVYWALGGVATLGLAVWLRPVEGQVNTVKQVSPGVYFHEGDLHGHGHCNNGWIVFRDYVLVVDANFPSGAKLVIPKIKGTTNKPIRFAFDTHHHGDHAYGNQVWVDEGAVPVGHTGVLEEMKRYETGYFGGKPGRWEDAAKGRKDVAESRLHPPTLLFPDRMIFDDGAHRVELLHLGVAHTRGDGWAWLPKEKILFSGDACVNGPFNYAGDGDMRQWIKTLDRAMKLGPRTVVPGHGPVADGSLLGDQQAFFRELLRHGQRFALAKKTPAEVEAEVPRLRQTFLGNERIKKFVGDMFPAQVEKAYVEMGGKPFNSKQARRRLLRSLEAHARDHSRSLDGRRVRVRYSIPESYLAGR